MAELEESTRKAAQQLFNQLFKYGHSSDESLIPGLRQLYSETVPLLDERTRAEMAVELAEHIENGRCSINALNAFLFEDPSSYVVCTATLAAVPMWPGGSPHDPLFSARELMAFVRQFSQVEEPRAVGMIQGMLLLGDRRIIHEMGPCWRLLSVPARNSLLKLGGMRVYAPVLEWLMDWLADCEGSEYAAVAGTLGRFADQAREQDEVAEVQRALPLWQEPPAPPIQDLQRWTFREYGEFVAPRLVEIAKAEFGDRVMPALLAEWGIPIDGVASPDEVRAIHERLANYRQWAGAVPGDVFRTSQRFPGVHVEPNTLLSERPSTLAAWGIFNPYGPTLNLVGRTNGKDVDFLWYAMLNPFQQQYVLIGSLVGEDRVRPHAIVAQLQELVGLNQIPLANGDTLPLVTCPPAFLLDRGDEVIESDMILGIFARSPGILSGDLNGVVEQLERTQGNPWDRATEQVHGWSYDRPEGAAERADRDELVAWLSAIQDEEQLFRELFCLREAWTGSIEQLRRTGNTDMADRALPLDVFDHVTGRLGLSDFSIIGGIQKRRAT